MDTTTRSATGRPFFRFLGNAKLKLLAVFLTVSTILLLTLYSGNLSGITTARVKDNISNQTDYWTWETRTQFRNTHLDKNNNNQQSETACNSFPSDVLSRVQIVLKTSATENTKRVNTHLTSVTRCISNLLVVSDLETEVLGHKVYDILADISPSARQKIPEFTGYDALQNGTTDIDGAAGWRLDRFKFLPMIERAKKVNPTAEWYVFLETDTYFVWDNLFRVLEQFDPSVPLYMGSPAPGRALEGGGVIWFAYGGSGFVLSRAAVDKLVARDVGRYGQFVGPSVSDQYLQIVTDDCCGDSVLGTALYEKGIKLSGMWPMFNAHPLDSIPFGDDNHWCQPVISMHKSLLSDMDGLAKWENGRNRTNPLLYADLINYHQLGDIPEKKGWDNGDWGGFIEPPDTLPQHQSLDACRQACHDKDWCMAFTYDNKGACVFQHSMRLGSSKADLVDQFTAGWDNEKIKKWRSSNQCESPQWMKPSLTRIF
ncbi:hypothetical protein N7499_009851 [Penicillium canescens]|nr:hypothetical protein N7522_001038 [Penicillium canescens]KAJ6071837.1 hypothetical protein N7499_009851 [Penicillium canescens]KAJ6170512.1 hypothetical protein N7485_007858 [Penicillium canescens]